MSRLDHLREPQGYKRAGNCAILALAVTARVPFDDALRVCTEAVRKHRGKVNPNWRGSMLRPEIEDVLQACTEAQYKPVCFKPRGFAVSLQDFAHATKGTGLTFYVLVKGHALTVCAGATFDQGGMKPAHMHKFRRRAVTAAWSVHHKEDEAQS